MSLPTNSNLFSSPIRLRPIMLHSAVAFFVIGLLAVFAGFDGLGIVAVDIAKVLFVAFATLSVARYVFRMLSNTGASRRSSKFSLHPNQE